MNATTVPTIADQVVQVINAICQKLGIVFDWSAQNVMPQLQILGKKIVTYKLVLALVGALVGLILIIAAIICIRKAIGFSKKYMDDYHDMPESQQWGMVFLYIATFIFALIGIPLFFSNLTMALTCLTFPEKVIYDYIVPILQTLTKK